MIFDQEGLSVGKKVIMDMSTHSDVMAFMRLVTLIFSVPFLSLFRFRQGDSNEWGPVPGVKMVVINRDGDVVKEVQGLGTSNNRKDWTDILMSFVLEAPVIMPLNSKIRQESSSSNATNKLSSTHRDLVSELTQMTWTK